MKGKERKWNWNEVEMKLKDWNEIERLKWNEMSALYKMLCDE